MTSPKMGGASQNCTIIGRAKVTFQGGAMHIIFCLQILRQYAILLDHAHNKHTIILL